MRVKFFSRMRTDILSKFRNTIEEYNMLEGADTVVAGVSGGADSVCLLLLLLKYRERLLKKGGKGFAVEAVHVNHGIRENADFDADFVKALCEKKGVSYRLFEYDVPAIAKERSLSTEEAGRIVRYEAFNSVLDNQKGVIAVAHNADDRAETLLFNVIRGAGLSGLASIKPVSGNIIRPLLYITRDEIEEYLSLNGEGFVTDETNLSDDYTRNKIRHNVLSYIKENINSGAVDNMTRCADMLYEADRFISEKAASGLSDVITLREEARIAMDVKKLLSYDAAVLKRMLYEAVAELSGRKKDISGAHIKAIYVLLGTGGTKVLDIIYGIRIRKEYDTLIMEKEPACDISAEAGERLLFHGTEISYEIKEDFDIDKIPKELYTKWFDYDKINGSFELRTRLPGDYLIIDASMRKKTLKNYLIDEKIPRELRDDIPLIADDRHIMWVIGHRISEYYKVSRNTKRVLEIKAGREEGKNG